MTDATERVDDEARTVNEPEAAAGDAPAASDAPAAGDAPVEVPPPALVARVEQGGGEAEREESVPLPASPPPCASLPSDPATTAPAAEAGAPPADADARPADAGAPPADAGAPAAEAAAPEPEGPAAPAEVRPEWPPVLVDVEPPLGSTRGGDELLLKGRNFKPGCMVEIDGTPVDAVFESETRLRIVAPPRREAGSVDIRIVNATGTAYRLPAAFVYRLPAPRIDSVSPPEGPSSGGTRVSVRGLDFRDGCSVFVCGVPVAVTFRGPEEIEVVTPSVSRDGGADVRVVNPDDQAHTADRLFRYIAALLPPSLAAVSPARGTQDGGLRVSLYGEDFAAPARVRFGGVEAEVTFLTRKELAAISPARAGGGAVDVEVVNPDGAVSALEGAFTYEDKPAPAITSVQPTSGPTIGGTKIVIEGANFAKGASVYVGRELPKDIVVKSATEIHAVVPPRKAAGVVDIEVALPGVPKAVMKNGFRYDATPAPTISSVSPNRGGTAGGTELTISGTGLLRETQVLVDGKPVKSVKLIDKTTLEVKMPPGEANKLVDVAMRNPDGKEAVQKRAFMYDPRYG